MALIFVLGFLQFYSLVFLTKYFDYVLSANYSLFVLGLLQIASLLINCFLQKKFFKFKWLGILSFPALYFLSISKLGVPLPLIVAAALVLLLNLQLSIVHLLSTKEKAINIHYVLELLGGICGVLCWYYFSSIIGFFGFALMTISLQFFEALRGQHKRPVVFLSVLLAVVTLICLKEPNPIVNKRERYQLVEHGQLIKQIWEPNGHVEILQLKDLALVLFEGGELRSNILPFDGDYLKLKQDYQAGIASMTWGLDVVAPHYFIEKPGYSAVLISAIGGQEIIAAKTFSAAKIAAVDINKSAQYEVSKNFRRYTGNIYDGVEIINQDGRNFIQHSNRFFDVIQIYSAANATYSSSLGAELLPSSLVTAEALQVYDQHLNRDGILQITQTSYLKHKATFTKAFGEDLFAGSKRMLVIRRKNSYFDLVSFLYKKNAWTQSEVDRMSEWLAKDPNLSWVFVFNPFKPQEELSDFNALAVSQNIASTDDKPFSKLRGPIAEIIQIQWTFAMMVFVMLCQAISVKFVRSISFTSSWMAFLMGSSFAVAQGLGIILTQKIVGNPAKGLAFGLSALLFFTALSGAVFHKFKVIKNAVFLLLLGVGTAGLSLSGISLESNLVIALLSLLLLCFFQSYYFQILLLNQRHQLSYLVLANGLGMALGIGIFNLSFVYFGLGISVVVAATLYLVVGGFCLRLLRAV